MNTDGNINAIERHLADCEEHDAWKDLQDQLEAARADAEEAEAYAEELEQELRDTQDRANAFAIKEYYTEMRAERAEIKLAIAVEALGRIARQPDYRLPSPRASPKRPSQRSKEKPMSDNDLIRRGDALKALDWRDIYGRNAQAAINAIPAVQPTVKPLEWCENPDIGEGGLLGGGVTNATYHAMSDGWAFHRSMFWRKVSTLEAAKAAAQADYEARILSVLDMQPTVSPDVAALVEALEYYADQYCEGFCQDLPSAGYTDEKCELDCGGCKARAALARVKGVM